jgi:hypothetical protein
MHTSYNPSTGSIDVVCASFAIRSEVKKGDLGFFFKNKEEFEQHVLEFHKDKTVVKTVSDEKAFIVSIECIDPEYCSYIFTQPYAYPKRYGKGEWVALTAGDTMEMAKDYIEAARENPNQMCPIGPIESEDKMHQDQDHVTSSDNAPQMEEILATENEFRECERFAAISESFNAIQEFLEYAWAERQLHLVTPLEEGLGVTEMDDLIYRFFEIDPKQLEKEREQILEQHRELNKKI